MKKINSRSNDCRSMLRLKKEIIKGISSHEEDIKVLVFDSTGEWLASGGWDGLLKLWNLAKGQLQWTKGLFSEAVACVSFIDVPPGNVVAISLEDTDVHCYDLISGKQQWVMDVNELRPDYISTFINRMNQTCWITPAPYQEKKSHFTLFNLHTREKQLINPKYLAKERLRSSGDIDIVSVDPLIAILTAFKDLKDRKNTFEISDNELIIYDFDRNELIVSEVIRKDTVYGLISSQETKKVVIAYVARQEHVLELWSYNLKEKALLKSDTISWRRRESWMMAEEIKHLNWLIPGKKVIVIETDNQVQTVNLQDNQFSRVKKVSSWKDLIPIKNNKLRALSKKSVVSAISISVDRKIAVANDKGAIAVGTMEGLTDLLSKGGQKDEETESIAFAWNKGGDKLVYCTGVDSQEVVVVSTGKEITIETLSCRKAFSGVNLPIIDIFWDCNNRLIFVMIDRIIFVNLQKGKLGPIWTFKAPAGNYVEDITINPLRTILICSLKRTFSESKLLFFDLKKSPPTYGTRKLTPSLPEGDITMYWGSSSGHLLLQTTGRLTDFPLTSKGKMNRWDDSVINDWTKVSWGKTKNKEPLLAFSTHSPSAVTLIQPKKGIIGKLIPTRPPIAISFIASTNKLVVAEDDGHLSMWDCSINSHEIWREDVDQAGCLCIESSPSGKQIITLGADQSMKLWDVLV